eukprot:gene5884-4093_t
MTKMTKDQKQKAMQERKQGFRRQEEVRLPTVPIFVFLFFIIMVGMCVLFTIGSWIGLGSGVTPSALAGIAFIAIA